MRLDLANPPPPHPLAPSVGVASVARGERRKTSIGKPTWPAPFRVNAGGGGGGVGSPGGPGGGAKFEFQIGRRLLALSLSRAISMRSDF